MRKHAGKSKKSKPKHYKKSKTRGIFLFFLIILLFVTLTLGVTYYSIFRPFEMKDVIKNVGNIIPTKNIEDTLPSTLTDTYDDFYDNGNDSDREQTENTTVAISTNSTYNQDFIEPTTVEISEDEETTTEDIDEVTFNTKISLKAYKAIDVNTNYQSSLYEVFGSSYSGGTIDLKPDGTFEDNLAIADVSKGKYTITDGSVTLNYNNGEVVVFEVLSKKGNIPDDVVTNYGGYYIYFAG